MKVESLVIVDQHATVNMYSSFVHTARHALGVDQIENDVKEITKFNVANLGSATRAKS